MSSVADLQIENDRTRVTRYRLPPGGSTGPHRHEHDYVIVPVVSGRLRVVGADGREVFADLEAGVAYFRRAGVEHNVFNGGERDIAFVEVEMLP
ncbi:MAG TPA: cupin domain-containing protein [Stellaceae bacterium]|nr:cupin domain-containing protein [Stellaceae bacterium]